MQYFFGILTFLISLFLILLILIQRGRGGGLAGALGGMGGQSAFGTKAGDLFTRITIVVAAVWILLSVAAIKVLNDSQNSVFGTGSPPSAFSPGATSKDQKGTTGSTDTNGPSSLTGSKAEAPAPDSSSKSPPGAAAVPAAPAATPEAAPATAPATTPPAAEKK
jgi:preprotein translocase subunit SecG